MTENREINMLVRPRRGVAIGTFFIWLIVAAVSGTIFGGIFESDVRNALKLPPPAAHWATSAPTSQNAPTNEIVSLVRDLQASQQRTAEDVRTVLQLQTSEQTATKTLSDAVAALQTKVDALQRPTVPVAKKPAPLVQRKPPAPNPAAETPAEPDQGETETGAPTRVSPQGR